MRFGVFSGGSAGEWDREAWRVGVLAAELGVTLDEEMLLLCDVRDLQTLHNRLRHALALAARQPWARPGTAAVDRFEFRYEPRTCSPLARAGHALMARLARLTLRAER